MALAQNQSCLSTFHCTFDAAFLSLQLLLPSLPCPALLLFSPPISSPLLRPLDLWLRLTWSSAVRANTCTRLQRLVCPSKLPPARAISGCEVLVPASRARPPRDTSTASPFLASSPRLLLFPACFFACRVLLSGCLCPFSSLPSTGDFNAIEGPARPAAQAALCHHAAAPEVRTASLLILCQFRRPRFCLLSTPLSRFFSPVIFSLPAESKGGFLSLCCWPLWHQLRAW
jgi:hypothetical protein